MHQADEINPYNISELMFDECGFANKTFSNGWGLDLFLKNNKYVAVILYEDEW
jgi:hypothetical protein